VILKMKLFKKLLKEKKGEIFLVCTIIIIIYMLSFIGILYELNVKQYNKTIEVQDFEAAFSNFQTETNNFVKSLLANYSQPLTIIVSNATAVQLMTNWLTFAEQQLALRGYTAVFAVEQTVEPFLLRKANGFIGLQGRISVYLSCTYETIDTQFRYNINYTLSFTNQPTYALIELMGHSTSGDFYIGYAEVTVNGGATTSYYNGTYYYSAPLVATDTIQAITNEQIIVTYVV